MLERVWEQREEVLYRAFFGDLGPGIYPIPHEVFSDVFQQPADPRWLHIGVCACPPSEKHAEWIYVTSGLSNPWETETAPQDPHEPSWLGVEFILRCTEGGEWAIRLVQRIAAFALLLAHGRYPGREVLGLADRIPLRGPLIPGSGSRLTWLVVCSPAAAPESFRLESGAVDFLQLVPVTEEEANLAREKGLDELLAILRQGGAYEVADPGRNSLVGGSI